MSLTPRDTLKKQLRASIAATNPDSAIVNAAVVMMQGHILAINEERRRSDDLAAEIQADIQRLKELGGKS